jgi:thioredoxin 1
MKINSNPLASELIREDIDQLKGPVLIEFGTHWCGYCQAAQPMISSALVNYPDTQHIKIEDAKGNSLGRSYSVRLWPTLIFLKDGTEMKRVVRPSDCYQIKVALNEINKS